MALMGPPTSASSLLVVARPYGHRAAAAPAHASDGTTSEFEPVLAVQGNQL